MRADLLEARPTLRAWLDEYAAIEADYLARLADWGIRIASRDADADVVRAAKDRLREKGAQFRNGDAGIVCGNLSSAWPAREGEGARRSSCRLHAIDLAISASTPTRPTTPIACA